MNNVKTKLKELVGEALLRTGVWERSLRSWSRRREVVVLTYHRVIEKWDRTLDYSQPGMVVTAETFDHQLTFLKKHFSIVPLSFLVNPKSEIPNPKSPSVPLSSLTNSQFAIRNSKSFARPFCSITFDDGWRDNYEIAFPILQKHGVPATIFLTTDFIGTNRAFWHTELMYLLLHGELSQLMRSESVFQVYPRPIGHRLMQIARMRRVPSAHDVDACIQTVKEICNEDVIRGLIGNLATALDLCRPFFSERRFFLDWDQVREMAAAGIEIGSHGCSHRVLTRLKGEEAEQEFVRSKRKIEGRIGQEIQHFAFPDGPANSDLIGLAGRVGYRTVCLCAFSPEKGWIGSLTLRRLGMAEAVSVGGDGSFSELLLLLWLSRAPRMRPA